MPDEITINLRGLTATARKAILKQLAESQKLIDDEVNKLALIKATRFDTEETPSYLSDMENM